MTYQKIIKSPWKINYNLFFLLFLFLGSPIFGQLKIGMSPKAIMPSTVTASSSYSVIIWVKNKGNVSYTGKIHLKYGVDSTQTLTNIIQTKYDSISVSNFLPGDSILKAFGETYDMPNGYRVNGNGSTVVIWPIIKTNPSATKDSLIRVVYVKKYTVMGIDELSFLKQPNLFPNPSMRELNFENTENDEPLKIRVFSLLGNYQEELVYQSHITISHLSNGVYSVELIYKNGLKSKPVRLIKN